MLKCSEELDRNSSKYGKELVHAPGSTGQLGNDICVKVEDIMGYDGSLYLRDMTKTTSRLKQVTTAKPFVRSYVFST